MSIFHFICKRTKTIQIKSGAGGFHESFSPWWRGLTSSVATEFRRLRHAYRPSKGQNRQVPISIRSLIFCLVCLSVSMGQTAEVIAAESNLDHKLSPLNDASAKPEFGVRNGSLIIAPIPFSDPMIDTGIALGAGYLFKIDEGSDPSMVGLGYLRSQNGSSAYGLTFNLALKDNRWSIGMTYIDADINYDLITALGTIPVSQQGKLIKSKLTYGITSDFHLGVSARYLESTIGSSNPIFPNLPTHIRLPNQFRTVGFGLLADYDRLDNKIYPTSGFNLSFSSTYNKPSGRFGDEYIKSILTYDKYFSLGENDVVAIRLTGCSAPGRVPFYDLCSIGGTDAFRGFNITQFLDNALVSSQVEYRKRLGKRLGVVAFGGIGGVGGGFDALNNVASAFGLGLRYRVSKKFPVDFAVDGSINDEQDSVLYISVGQRF